MSWSFIAIVLHNHEKHSKWTNAVDKVTQPSWNSCKNLSEVTVYHLRKIMHRNIGLFSLIKYVWKQDEMVISLPNMCWS